MRYNRWILTFLSEKRKADIMLIEIDFSKMGRGYLSAIMQSDHIGHCHFKAVGR